MAKNKVLVEFQIVQKGKTISVVQRETEKLRKTQDKTAQSTKNLTKQQDMGYGRQKQGVVQTANSTKNFSKLANTIDGGSGSLVGAYATLAANVFAASAAFNALAGAARFEQLKDGLDILGTNSGRTLGILASDLKAVTGNALSLEQAFSGAALGISGGFGGEELKGLAKIARGASLTLGRDLADAFDRLTRGAIKLEPEILDELGIMVRLDDAVDQYATQLGKTSGQLSQAERRQAFMNAILVQGTEKFGEIADSVEPTVFDQLGATFGDLTKNIFGFINSGLSPVIKVLADNTLLLSAAMIGFGSTLTKQIVPGLADAGAAARRNAERMQQIAEASEAAGDSVKKSFIGNLDTLNRADKSAKNFTQSIVDGDTSLANLTKAQGRVNKSLGQLTAKRAQEAGLNTVLIKQRKEEQRVLAELILMEEAKAAISLKTRQAEVAASAAQNAANQITLFTAGGQTLSQTMSGISAAANILEADLFDIASEAAGGAENITRLGKMSIKGQVAFFKFANGARAVGAALLSMLPLIAAVLAAVGVAILIFNKLFNTKEQKAFNEGLKEQRDMFDSLDKKAEAYNDTFSSGLPIGQIQIRQFEIISNSISEINDKLKDNIKLRKKADESRVTDNALGLSESEATKAAAKFMQQLDEGYEKSTFKKFMSFLGFGASAGGDAALGAVFSLIGTQVDQVKSLFGENADQLGDGILTDILLGGQDQEGIQRSIASIFQNASKSIELETFKELLGSEIPGQSAAIAQVFDEKIIPKILRGAEITEKDFAEAIDEADKRTRLLDDNFRNLNKTLKDSEKAANSFINALAPKTKFDNIRLQFEAIQREIDGARRAADKAGIDGGEAIGVALSEAGPNIARLVGGGFFEAQKEFKAQEKAINDTISTLKTMDVSFFSDDEVENEKFRTRLIEAQKNELIEQGKVLGEHEETFEATLELLTKLSRQEVVRQATLKGISQITKEIARFNKTGSEATRVSLTLSKTRFSLEKEQLKANRDILENTFVGMKVGEKALSLEEFKKKSLEEQVQIARDNGIQSANVFALQKQTQDEKNLAFQQELDIAGEVFQLQKASLEAANAEFALEQQKLDILAKRATLQAQIDKFSRTGSLDLNTAESFKLELDAMKDKRDKEKEIADNKLLIIDAETEIEKARLLVLEKRMKLLRQEEIARLKADQGMTQSQAEAATAGMTLDTAGITTALDKSAQLRKDIVNETLGAMDDEIAVKILSGFSKGLDLAKSGNVIDGYATALESAVDPEGDSGATVTMVEKVKLARTALAGFEENLKALGPEGEALGAMTNGVLTIADSFAVLSQAGDNAAERISAIQNIFAALGQAFKAQSDAKIAAIDAEIDAEKRRDGKSKESVSKIKAMEAKKLAMEKKAFEMNKKMLVAQTIMNTAAGVMATMKTGGFFASPLAMIVAAMGAAQLAIISKQKFQGGTGSVEEPKTTSLTIGKRSNSVDVARGATGGELNFLRGGRTTGQDLGGAGGAMGRRGYAMGFRRGYADGGIVVGERGPEVITPSTSVDIIPNFALGGQAANVNFTIQAIDASGVEDVLRNQQGNIIRMIREAANENGERFLETVDTQTYGSNT